MTFDRKAWRDQWKEANPDKTQEQIKRDYAAKRAKIKTETPEERVARLQKITERRRKWRADNPDKIQGYQDAYAAKRKADPAEHQAKNKRTLRNYALRTAYGITIEKYEEMAAAQGHQCAICGARKATVRHSHYSWRVDHCHTHGTVRSLLCHSCNIVLGLTKESIDTLKKMIKYLKLHKLPEEVNHHEDQSNRS